MVCLHGLGRSPADWDGVRSGLQAFGTVRTPALPARPSDALAHADGVISAGDIVIGHSMGGVLALRLARERPRPLRMVILTGCFFGPARNGRALARTVGDYAAHRVAFARSAAWRGRNPGPRGDSARALGSLIRLAAQAARHDAVLAVSPSVLVVHARDDHHVPIDFAVGAAARQPQWDVRILDQGGHHAHMDRPELWLAAVTPWLQASSGRIDSGAA